MFRENSQTLLHNKELVMSLPGVLHKIEATEIMISSGQNRKQTDTGGLAKCSELKKGAKVMITVNIDIQDRLINGQVEKVFGFEIVDKIAKRVYIKFDDDEVGRKAISLNCFCFQNELVPTEKVHAEIPIVKGTLCPTFKKNSVSTSPFLGLYNPQSSKFELRARSC